MPGKHALVLCIIIIRAMYALYSSVFVAVQQSLGSLDNSLAIAQDTEPQELYATMMLCVGNIESKFLFMTFVALQYSIEE